MKNKSLMTAAAIAILLLFAAILFWYFNPYSDVRIVSIEAPEDIGVYQLGYMRINLQNNASENVTVTVYVKNAFVDEKGVSLKGFTIASYGNLSYNESNAVDTSQKQVQLEPGSNYIIINIGYQVPGKQKVVVEVYQRGRLADSGTVEVNVHRPQIALDVRKHKGTNGSREVYALYPDLGLNGMGSAPDVVRNITVIDESTNATVSTAKEIYSLPGFARNIWVKSETSIDPLTDTTTYVDTTIVAPSIIIELSRNGTSDEKYMPIVPVVVKGKLGDRYKVVVTATWREQVVRSEIRIPW